jgi:hypothetical protein
MAAHRIELKLKWFDLYIAFNEYQFKVKRNILFLEQNGGNFAYSSQNQMNLT